MPTWGKIIEEIQEENESRPSAFDKVRRKYLQEISDVSGNEVILYSSGWTEIDADSPHFSISENDVHGFMQTINGIKSDQIDLLLHSPGGSAEVAEQIVRYLREKFDYIRIIIPQAAMSAATLMCCAADEVLLGHHSSLGPTDPQMLIPTETGRRWVAAQSIVNQFEEVDKKVQQGEDIVHYTPILSQYDPALKEEAENQIKLSEELAEEWTSDFMFSNDPKSSKKGSEVADYLSNHDNFLSHNRRISRGMIESETPMSVSELEENQDLQDAVLSAFHAAIATHSHQRYAKIIENQHGDVYARNIEG